MKSILLISLGVFAGVAAVIFLISALMWLMEWLFISIFFNDKDI